MHIRLFRYTLVFVLAFLTLPSVQAQDDNIGWFSVSASTKIQKDWNFTVTPIIRLNEDFSSFQNSSLDYAFKKKIDNNWSVVFFGRTWFIPEATNRQFFWLDINYNQKLKDLSWLHRVRWHQAFDIENNIDPDFIRYTQQLKYTRWGKFQPLVGIELWWGLNGDLQLERLRYMPGFLYKFNDHINLSAVYWREESINLDPKASVNLYRINLAFTLPALWKGEG